MQHSMGLQLGYEKNERGKIDTSQDFILKSSYKAKAKAEFDLCLSREFVLSSVSHIARNLLNIDIDSNRKHY